MSLSKALGRTKWAEIREEQFSVRLKRSFLALYRVLKRFVSGCFSVVPRSQITNDLQEGFVRKVLGRTKWAEIRKEQFLVRLKRSF